MQGHSPHLSDPKLHDIQFYLYRPSTQSQYHPCPNQYPEPTYLLSATMLYATLLAIVAFALVTTFTYSTIATGSQLNSSSGLPSCGLADFPLEL